MTGPEIAPVGTHDRPYIMAAVGAVFVTAVVVVLQVIWDVSAQWIWTMVVLGVAVAIAAPIVAGLTDPAEPVIEPELEQGQVSGD